MPHDDFFVLTSNPSHGNVYIIGDVHGEIGAFKTVLSQLNPTDTLIIAGDLIDRGENDARKPSSADVLEQIITLNAAEPGTAPRIYAIKGNHERYFLKILARLRQEAPLTMDDMKTFKGFIQNGGSWIFKHPDATKNHELQTWCLHYSCRSELVRSERYIEKFMTELFGSTHRAQYLVDNIIIYEDYISSLPYLLKINEDENIAWVAHADLTLSDEVLDGRIERDEGLSEDEIYHITEARPYKLNQNSRTPESCVVYCGHNIIDNPASRKPYRATPVRRTTNHINLDVGAFFTKGLLLLNHTQHTVAVVGEKIEPKNAGLLKYAKSVIEGHLAMRLSTNTSSIGLSRLSIFEASTSTEENLERHDQRKPS